MYTVHEVARMAGVSVRTLHYYDQLGLLPPAAQTEAGYRLYDDRAMERLQEILFLRELDFPLKEIGPLLEAESPVRELAVERHRELLMLKIERLQGLVGLCERIMKGETSMSLKEFDQTDLENARTKYAEEIKQRWGETEAYRESERRAQKRKPAEWKDANAAMEAMLTEIAQHVTLDPASSEAQALAARWQQMITDNFYPCTDEILKGLGEMYVSDERFMHYMDGFGEGTARFLSEAIRAK